MIKKKLLSEWWLIFLLSFFKLLIHLLTNTNYELHRDAFLYLAQSDHLEFGYSSVPPFIAMVGKITQLLFGDSVFAVRLFPAIVGAISVIVISLIVRNLGGKIWAILLAGCAFIFSPAFLRSNTLFQPVTFNQFFWLILTYFMVKLLQTENTKYWIHLGIISGLAFLNKYSVVFLILSLVLSLAILSRRKLLLSKYIWQGALLGFLLILPNLIWQFNHNCPVINHMLTLQRTQLVHVNLVGFLLMQIMMNFPSLLIWLFGLLYLLFFKEGQKWRSLGYTYVILLLVLILLRGKHYYSLGVYPMLFAFGGYGIEKYFIKKLALLKPIMLILLITVSIPVIPYSLPLLSYDKMVIYGEESKKMGLQEALRWEDGRIHALPQDYADMTGWKELADIVIKTYQNLNEQEQKKCVIYAENYGEAGAIKYYTKKLDLPEPASFSDSFLFWAPDSINFQVLIYVNDEVAEILPFFESVSISGKITNPYSRETGITVYVCKKPTEKFLKFYTQKVKVLKDQFR